MTPDEERQAWRTYAAAALQGMLSASKAEAFDGIDVTALTLATCKYTEAMLAAEKERF